MEQWKPVSLPPFDKAYEVSTSGKVRSVSRTDRNGRIWGSRIRKPYLNRGGYECVHLSVDGVQTVKTVHGLVARTFLGLPPGEISATAWQVNHKNGVKNDNRLENLEWVDKTGNQTHALSMGLWPMGEKSGHAVITTDIVLRAKAMRANGMKYARIAEELGHKYQTIYGAITGRSWKHLL